MQKNNRAKMFLVIGGIWPALLLFNSLSSTTGKTLPAKAAAGENKVPYQSMTF